MQIEKFKVATLTAIIIFIGVIPLIAAATPPLTIPSSGYVRYPITRPLHTEGSLIKDDLGNIVFLRGVNRPWQVDDWGAWQAEGMEFGDGWGRWDPVACAYNLDKMKELLDANVVRCHLNVGQWYDNAICPQTGVSVKDALRAMCEMALERGMYVILDGYNNGIGLGQSPLPWDPPSSYIPDIQGFIDWWLDMHAYYGDLPNVIWDLWNEPTGGDQDGLEYFNACQQVVNALRAAGSNHLTLYQFGYTGYESAQEIPNGYILEGGNIVYSIHFYRFIHDYSGYWIDEGGVPCYSYEPVRDSIMQGWAQCFIDAQLPWGNFEYGCAICGPNPVPDPENELEWFRNVHKVFNENNASYTVYLWWDTSRNWGVLEDSTVYPWCPPLNEAGEILRDAIVAGGP